MTDKSIKRPSNQSFARNAGRMVLIMISLLLTCIPMLVGILLLLSRGKPKPFVDENKRPLAGSISEKVFVTLNGVEQGMFIQSSVAQDFPIVQISRQRH